MSHTRYWLLLSYGAAVLMSATLGYFLLRVPIQTTDSFTNILLLDAPFMDVLRTGIEPGYLRPGLWAQLKIVYDLSQGEYFYWFRWTAVVEVLCVLLPFTAVLRPVTAPAALVFPLALAVLVGHHAFAWTIREAFPVNAYLTNVIFCAVVVNLTLGAYRWWKDVVVVAIVIAAVTSLESGLLVGGIVVAGYLLGMRGVSRAGVGVVLALIAAYFVLRFGVLGTGLPSLIERESSFGFERYSGEELSRIFEGRVHVFYAYNVIASVLGTLFAEPRDGMWRLTRSLLDGSPDPRLLVGVVSSSIATGLIGRYVWVRREFWRRWELERGDRIVMLFVLVLLANAGISFAYTKDVIMSPAGYFYAAAFFVGCRHYVDSLRLEPVGTRARRLAPGIGTALSSHSVGNTASRSTTALHVLPALTPGPANISGTCVASSHSAAFPQCDFSPRWNP